ncbi:hypothetical protein HNO53_09390 [Billgrantia antri]|uniref:Lipopolysaccharide kinase (Kdo/WaaP) family protein n=1 Tax=Halomonas sulfidivorans TaxID=2733488 RepID=A0ABX7WF16_9GAMM|nr:lipopolysaccharide kinase InaA family protein [Halomonas sulfidivorans]QTP58900.1 hypothetical protein HNO53_09390 [Halomonas sulfidivorans]
MKLLDIPFDDRRRRYLVFHANGLPDKLALASTTTTAQFEAIGSSRFFVSRDGKLLAKVVPDKFRKAQAPLKWLLRDYIEKRWLAQCDARKEYNSLRILRRAGLATPRCHGWGLSLNPGNRNASLLLMEQVHDARPGGEVFKEMSEANRIAFLERFCAEVIQLAHTGYVHRDLHYNNLLLTKDEELIWVDSHVRRLPTKIADQWPAISSMFTKNKLNGEKYKKHVEELAHASWFRN